MGYAICDDFNGKTLDSGDGLLASGAVSQDSWQFGHLRYPAPVALTVEFDRQPHRTMIRIGHAQQTRA